ncbi:MAG: PEP-CTERM sorting domain-containing protein [Phycisphaerae bacterium]|nr:PEP-CTERM sorting domain-containing protein [Phycisphaerae bacterium]
MKSTLSLAAAAALLVVSSANAGLVPLDNTGWQATWDGRFDGLVDIWIPSASPPTASTIFIQKSAQFTQGPDEFGQFPTIPITFMQIGPSTITRIVIQDEIITNTTGVDWTDFHFDLMDSGDAWFEHGPGFFFTTSPLDNQVFSADNKSFSVDGFGRGPNNTDAVVPNNSVWYPGDGPFDGNLVIRVVSKTDDEPYTVFTLKETPTPEPASLLLLALGGLLLRRR